ncbi:CAMK protein kinase [Helicocarpus griseus UAMH5409]|uniref:CAMK protein kinase n=1 Tax=Helicocarpus griseus UAMH5409 TaxID=1447875 RepID=A0A2B7YAZ5_9EURO|nr:CAMK protein kinase [Helicocarpus griseus UAMH5409]
MEVHSDRELIIGRNSKLCDMVLCNDMGVSNKHLRIYVIIFDYGNPGEVGPLVYAQDMSRFGTLWNDMLPIRKGDTGILLSDGDELKLSNTTTLIFQTWTDEQKGGPFTDEQKREMKHFERRYRITSKVLGCGAYGKVHMAISTRYRKQVACKIIDIGGMRKQLDHVKREKSTEFSAYRPARQVDVNEYPAKVEMWAQRRRETSYLESKLKVYKREVEILKDLWHPNIISLEKVFLSQNTIYIFQELVTAGDLFSFLEYKEFNLTDIEAVVIVHQVTLAIRYLHKNNVVHRDIKPDNVLMTSLTNGARVVLTDFGCARRLKTDNSRMDSSMGTLEYTAPISEVPRTKPPRNGKGYTKAVDMWSLGCLTAVLLTGGSPFADPETGKYSEKMALNCDLSSLEKERDWKRVGKRAKDFVRKLLVLDEEKRMTAQEAICHEWFTNPIYKKEFARLYERATSDWRRRTTKDIQVVSDANIETGVSKKLVHWRKTPYTPVEWPYMPFHSTVHRVIYPGRKDSQKKSPCRDVEKEKRIYPWSNKGKKREKAVSRAFSQTENDAISDAETEGIRQMLSPSELGEGQDTISDEERDEKAKAELMRSLGAEEPAETGQTGMEETEHGAGTNVSRIRMPFSPDAWNAEDKTPEQPSLPYPAMPQSSNSSEPHRVQLGGNGFTPINPPNKSNNRKTEVDDLSPHNMAKEAEQPAKAHGNLPNLQRPMHLLDVYNGNHGYHNGNIENGEGPSRAPQKRKRDIYDFEDDEGEVYEEIDDLISGKKRRVVYGQR